MLDSCNSCKQIRTVVQKICHPRALVGTFHCNMFSPSVISIYGWQCLEECTMNLIAVFLVHFVFCMKNSDFLIAASPTF